MIFVAIWIAIVLTYIAYVMMQTATNFSRWATRDLQFRAEELKFVKRNMNG